MNKLEDIKHSQSMTKNAQLAFLIVVLVLLLSYIAFNTPNTLDYIKNSSFTILNMFKSTLGSKFFSTGGTVKEAEVTEPISIFSDLTKSLYFTPKRLYASETAIDIQLEEVGVESTGHLQTPASWDTGGWYYKSSKAGDKGNIIINAHYDTNSGAPAAFWELKNLANGDKVFLFDDLGRSYTYIVSEIFYIDVSDPDRLKIFENNDNVSELTLVTCGGVWVPSDGYNKRLVVKAIKQ